MSSAALFFVIVALGLIAWLAARARAIRVVRAEPRRVGSLPSHHAWHLALWTVLPAALFVAGWNLVAPGWQTARVLHAPAAGALPTDPLARGAILADARALARDPTGAPLDPRATHLAPAYREAEQVSDWTGTVIALLLAVAGAAYATTRLRPGFAARARLERLVLAVLLAASLVAILTTAGMLAALLVEARRFFAIVPVNDFLLGRHWGPQVIDPADPGADLGALPLFWGTFLIGAVIAMAVAVPFGLLSAIYLTQYAAPTVRRWVKPLIEILAGVPTVVYGYFAALTVAPAVRRLGLALGDPSASSESALAAGLVMGVMIIPYVSSMADDSLAAVPADLRDASLAMGATSAETIRRVLLPAAMPGVIGGILLAVSRAIGETMIVVMAASAVATLSADPFARTTAVTRQIVDLLTGEAAFDSPKTLAAFALGLALFVVTLLLNIVALAIVRRHRHAYD